MCEHHEPWLEVCDLSTGECLYFGDLDGLCRNPKSPHYLERCPQRGRPPWELAAKERQREGKPG